MAKHDDGEARASDTTAADGSSASARTRQMRLLRRVAEALQVPQASLHDAPLQPEVRGSAADDDLDAQCAALLLAYRRIRDPAERRALLTLVQATADRT